MRVPAQAENTVVEPINVFEIRPKEPKQVISYGPGVWERLSLFSSFFSPETIFILNPPVGICAAIAHISVSTDKWNGLCSQAVHSGDLRALHRRFLRGGWLLPSTLDWKQQFDT